MSENKKLQAIGAYLEQYPPAGFTDRYSAAGWSHIARAVLSAAAIYQTPEADRPRDRLGGSPPSEPEDR